MEEHINIKDKINFIEEEPTLNEFISKLSNK